MKNKMLYIRGNMKEIFKDIKGYENIYQVSNFGNVKSLRRTAKNQYGAYEIKEKILKPGKDSLGYLCVVLRKENTSKSKRIHRLIAEHFIENPNGLKDVDHKNRDVSDNRIENLRWCSRVQNCANSKGKSVNKTSKYKGVHFSKIGKSWCVFVSGKYFGYYKSEIEAAKVYNKKAKEAFGEFAYLNNV